MGIMACNAFLNCGGQYIMLIQKIYEFCTKVFVLLPIPSIALQSREIKQHETKAEELEIRIQD